VEELFLDHEATLWEGCLCHSNEKVKMAVPEWL
jgi:hypothetical protein